MRRRYLIAYDIAEPKRLRRVIKVMEAYGQRLQYSVFLCDLSNMDVVRWRAELVPILSLAEDSVVRIDLGKLDSSAPIEVLGVPRTMPRTGAVIV